MNVVNEFVYNIQTMKLKLKRMNNKKRQIIILISRG